MRRRRLIVVLGGAAAAWQSAGCARGAGPPRRIAVLMGVKGGDPEGEGRVDALRAGLKERGWVDGETAKLEVHWAGGEMARIRELVTEIVAASPDIIVANGTVAASSLHQATRTIPVIFVLVADPVGLGCIDSLGRPGGNMTGFTFFDPQLIGKWFQLLKEVSPGIASTSLIFNPETAGFYYKFLEVLQGVCSAIKLAPLHGVAGVEGVLAELAESPGSSVIGSDDPFNVVHGRGIVAPAGRFP